MRSTILHASFAILVTVFPSVSSAQVTQTDAQMMGLEIAWRGQLQLPRAGRGLVSAEVWADSSKSTQYAVVELPDRTLRVSAAMMGKKGPIGIEEAKKLVSAQAARALGKPDGFQVAEVTVPDLKLIIATSDGLVQALDAESGRLLWATPCGRSRAPAQAATFSKAGVSIIHGTNYYLLDWETGKQKLVKPLGNATSKVITSAGNTALVCDLRGRIQSISLGDTELPPYQYVIDGNPSGAVAALKDESFMGIASDRGYINVFQRTDQGPRAYIRFEADAPIGHCFASANNAFYVGSYSGTLTKFTAESRLGNMQWSFRVPGVLEAAPLIVGEHVYIACQDGSFYAISDSDGELEWSSSILRARAPLALLGDEILLSTNSGEVAAIEIETGRLIAKSAAGKAGKAITNSATDRLYLVSRNGSIQCLRKKGAILPTITMPSAAQEEKAAKPANTMPTPETGNQGLDPFSGGAAGGGDPFSGGADPFGGSDPFGGGVGGNAGEGAMEDPFGGN